MSVYFYGCITMDGYLADKNHNLDWLYQTGTGEETGYADFYRNMDITIMGKRTFMEIEKNGRGGEDLSDYEKLCVYTFRERASKGIYT